MTAEDSARYLIDRWPLYLVAACLTMMYMWGGMTTIHDVLILQKFDPYTYQLAYERDVAAGVPWTLNVCPDYAAPTEAEGFAPGLVLDQITFIHKSGCWSLNPDLQASFFNRKDKQGKFVSFTH